EIRGGSSQALESKDGSTRVEDLDGPGIRDNCVPVSLPQATLLAIGAVRRQAVEAPDKSVRFASAVTATLCCDARAVDPALGARLLQTFKGFIENPLTMLV
ncbi:MAG: 2-oxo acid dehydrogenase subunit E2, partial [Pseudorhodoplanes sp.]